MAELRPGGKLAPRVAITRSIEDNRSLASELRAAGFEVVAAPLIEVAPAADGGRELVDALAGLDRYRWVVLTSVNGVRAIAAARSPEPWPETVAVAAIGPSTAEAVLAAGLPVNLVPDRATAAGLVDAFPSAEAQLSDAAGRVLAPLAELASATVESGLRSKGWLVDRVEAYRTVAPVTVAIDPSGTDPATADLVAFFSPSTVDRWTERFGVISGPAVCVGPSTAARAVEVGFESVFTADPHTEAGVVAAIVAVGTGAGWLP